MKNISIIGASGFVGYHLVPKLLEKKDYSLSLLAHKNILNLSDNTLVEIVKGSLFDSKSLDQLIKNKSTVINLAYLNNVSKEENIRALQSLIDACQKKQVKRIIHCSTAIIVGRTKDDLVTEAATSQEQNEYEKTKNELEILLIKSCKQLDIDVIILRPTCVFGEQGKNLIKLADDLQNKSWLINYLKSCLYNSRTMNLISIKDVISVLDFLITVPIKNPIETFIISDDLNPDNNFKSIEKIFIKELGIDSYPFPIVKIPPFILKYILLILKKSNINPHRKFSREKIEKYNWKSSTNLKNEITDFVKWYRQNKNESS